MERHSRPACGALLLIWLSPLLAGCDEPRSAVAATNVEPEVGVISVTPRPRALVRELPGRIAPTRIADVRPRISGIVVERLFHQGSVVRAGDPLYRIDQRPLEVEVQACEAALKKTEAALDLAAHQEKRTTMLAMQKVVSEAQHEKALVALRQAEADVAARQADVARARLKLSYATIRAPIGGVVGAALVSEGALVVENESSLATIQQLDPVYADFTQSVTEMNRLRRAFSDGDLDQITPAAARVRLVLDDGEIYASPGKLLFSESRVDAQTGQVTLRAEFPNPSRELLPGSYVRVLVDQGVDADAIAVPQQSVQRNAGGGSEVFLIGQDGRVKLQPVRLGEAQQGTWLISEGLRAGDRVVVDGFQKLAAGDRVKPIPLMDASASADASLGLR